MTPVPSSPRWPRSRGRKLSLNARCHSCTRELTRSRPLTRRATPVRTPEGRRPHCSPSSCALCIRTTSPSTLAWVLPYANFLVEAAGGQQWTESGIGETQLPYGTLVTKSNIFKIFVYCLPYYFPYFLLVIVCYFENVYFAIDACCSQFFTIVIEYCIVLLFKKGSMFFINF